MNTYEKILAKSEELIAERIRLENEQAQERANADREKIEKAIDLIKNNLLYKKVKKGYSGEQYVLATEDMFYEDYTSNTEYVWQRGITYTGGKDNTDYIYSGVFKVNGERYYDIRYIIKEYENNLKKTSEKIKSYGDKLRDITDEYEKLVKEAPRIKALILEAERLRECSEMGE